MRGVLGFFVNRLKPLTITLIPELVGIYHNAAKIYAPLVSTLYAKAIFNFHLLIIIYLEKYF